MGSARVVCLAAGLALMVAACGADDPSRPQAARDPGAEHANTNGRSGGPTIEAAVDVPASVPVQETPTNLAELARGLIPPEADDVSGQDLAVEECGIQPVFPCVRDYFVTEGLTLRGRLDLVRRQARSAGWRILSVSRDRGATVKIRRGRYFAEYMIERDDAVLCQAAARCAAGTMLTVVGPPAPLPAPSVEERATWSAEKTAFIESGNGACSRALAQMNGPEDVLSALREGLEELSALKPPEGEEEQVSRVLRPLRNLVRAAVALNDEEIGEGALPAAVAVGLFARRFNAAASRYGLESCATLG